MRKKEKGKITNKGRNRRRRREGERKRERVNGKRAISGMGDIPSIMLRR